QLGTCPAPAPPPFGRHRGTEPEVRARLWAAPRGRATRRRRPPPPRGVEAHGSSEAPPPRPHHVGGAGPLTTGVPTRGRRAVAWRRVGLRRGAQAGVAGELQRHDLVVDPDLAAVLRRDVLA